jgi:Protein of unknown function (DUF3300)
MRERAEKAGNLKSTSQENVTQQGQAIVIEPADSEVVYIPAYDPWLVYGEPIGIWPDWYWYPGLRSMPKPKGSSNSWSWNRRAGTYSASPRHPDKKLEPWVLESQMGRLRDKIKTAPMPDFTFFATRF